MDPKEKTTTWNIGGGLLYNELFNLEQLLRLMNQANPAQRVRMSVYDSHPGLIWNGGRVILRCNQKTKEDAVLVVQKWNDLGVSFYLTFSNHLIEKKHLSDPRCNYFLENCHNSLNGIVCTSDILRDYIRNHFPRYKIKSSVMKPYLEGKDFWRSSDYYKSLLDRFDTVVLSPRVNNDVELIGQLEQARIEILANEACLSDCPLTVKHYQSLNLANISGDWDAIEETYYFCNKKHGKALPEVRALELSVDQIRYLQSVGVWRFKLQGRTDAFHAYLRQCIQKFIIAPNLTNDISLVY